MANHALPLALTRFIGREKEIAEIARWIDLPGLQNLEGLPRTRLLTLTGSGGCGKTRLAREVAAQSADAFEQNVAWIEFAPLSDPARVPGAVAQAFDIRESADQPLIETLIHFLYPQKCLFVFDNCEHLISACAQITEALLRACPRVVILATSRESLNLPGEIAWRVPPLKIPDPQKIIAPEKLLVSESARLFVDRARSIDPTFSANGHHARAIAQICARLDGMPLALELAAARVKTLSVEQIAARLDDRFRLLTTGSRTAPTRQQTLRATMDWSFGLLDEPERILFRRLAVFAGGWTLDAAEAICVDAVTRRLGDTENEIAASPRHPIAASEIFDVLSHLVDKSLVNVETRDGETRYRMLETIRQYACEKLNDANEVEMMRARHCDFFVALAETAEPQLKGPDAKEWMDRLEREYDNIRAVFEYAMANDVQAAVRLAWALLMLWVRRGDLNEAHNVMLRLLAHSELQSANHLRLQALKTIGFLQLYIKDTRATLRYYEEALSIAKRFEDEDAIAFTLHGMGRISTFVRDYPAAHAYLEESLALYRPTANRWGEATALFCLGDVMGVLGERELSRTLLEESLRTFRGMGDICDSALPLQSLGRLAREQGDYASAVARMEECLEIEKRINDRMHRIITMLGLGYTNLLHGDYRRAVQIYTDTVELLERRGTPALFIQWLIPMAELIAKFGKPIASVRLLGAATALHESLLAKGDASFVYGEHYGRVSKPVRAQLDDATFNAAWNVGYAMTLEQATQYALAEIKIPDTPDASAPSPRQIAKEKFDGLTAREREVAALVAQCKTNRDIADDLVLSERTIEGHVGNILNKLGFNARAQIAAWAVEKGLPRKDKISQ